MNADRCRTAAWAQGLASRALDEVRSPSGDMTSSNAEIEQELESTRDKLRERDKLRDLPRSTILLVDDDDAVRAFMRSVFEMDTVQLLEARNGEEALSLVKMHDGAINLLITDVMMPGMTGPELACRCTDHRPDLKVLFVSGFMGEMLHNNALLAEGTARFLPKPFTIERLREVIGEDLDLSAE
jgi:two-component system cell cycle sensor histidine kinase/response regulator CckA